MNKILAAILGTTIAALSAATPLCFAAADDVGITGISAKDGVVYIDACNNSDKEQIFTLTVLKDDDSITTNQRIYSVLQRIVAADGEEAFDVPIIDEKKGVSGTGRYIVTVQNEDGERKEDSFYWATEEDVSAFVEDFKEAAVGVTDADKAYEKLMPVLTSEENAGAVFRIGIDLESFMESDEDVRNEILNLLYEYGVDSLNAETFPVVFSNIFGLAIYNSGDKAEGVEIISPVYNDKAADSKLIGKAVGNMDDSFDTIEDFNEGFAVAYGIETIRSAKVDEMGDVLTAFADETDECKTVINKIKNLSSAKRYAAFEYIVDAAESEIKSVSALSSLLESAYKSASSSSSSNSGGSLGSGGGSSGSSSNKAPVSGGSVSSATGSGTPDTKVDRTAVYIFTDMTDEHWAAEAVTALKDRGIVSGTDTGAFEPDRAVTREEFTKMLTIACGIDTEGYTADFADVKDGEWYVPYIGAAADKGIVNGIGNSLFGIGEKITRQDMATMAARAVEMCGINTDKVKDFTAFADEELIAEYAKDSIKMLFEAGIINGKGGNSFDPLGNATRAEAAKIIYEAFKGGI